MPWAGKRSMRITVGDLQHCWTRTTAIALSNQQAVQSLNHHPQSDIHTVQFTGAVVPRRTREDVKHLKLQIMRKNYVLLGVRVLVPLQQITISHVVDVDFTTVWDEMLWCECCLGTGNGSSRRGSSNQRAHMEWCQYAPGTDAVEHGSARMKMRSWAGAADVWQALGVASRESQPQTEQG